MSLVLISWRMQILGLLVAMRHAKDSHESDLPTSPRNGNVGHRDELYGGTRRFARRIQLLRCPVQTIKDFIARPSLVRVAFKALSAVRRLKHESERSKRSLR